MHYVCLQSPGDIPGLRAPLPSLLTFLLWLCFREDSRLHACIVCASISCPNVRREAFRPERVGQQMDDQLQQFLANPKKGEFLCEFLVVTSSGR